VALLASTSHGIARATSDHVELIDTPFADLDAALAAGEDLAQLAGRPTRGTVALHDLSLLPPVGRPSKIWAIGYAYRDHREETGFESVDEAPVIFLKAPSSVVGHGADIVLPPEAPTMVDYEGELAVVIGRRATAVSEDDAMAHVAGYTIGNDVSARDVQRGAIEGRPADTSTAKSFDTFTPLGPWLATIDGLADPHDLRLRTWVNGDLRQDARTSQLVHSVPSVVSYLSRQTTLLPGDVIMTGTPGGIGGRQGLYLRSGDTVTIEIESIGTLVNRVAGAATEATDGRR
jgi:2-keto-4-pentenoate hydratase/2-oxohepta-3-ene-1,7-dioic acid hydratase in catechol pathway